MSETPFIKFYPGDFLGGVGGLSPTERGVYITMLCLIWDNDGPVDYDEARLARRCGAPKAAFKKAIEALIDLGKLFYDGGKLTNERAEKTLMDRRNRIKNAYDAANSRWGAQKEKSEQNQCENDAEAFPEQCAEDAKPEARSQIEKEEPDGSSKKPRDPPEKHRRAVSLPEGWVPSEKNILDAQSRNFTDEEIRHEAERFRDYHLAKGTTFKDWDAGWRTWLGNARSFGQASRSQANNPGRGGSSIASIVARRRLADRG